jgi:hypothetical protein
MVDQLEHGVKVEVGVRGDSRRELSVEPCQQEAFLSPGENGLPLPVVDYRLAGSTSHIGLATHRRMFLPLARRDQQVRTTPVTTLIDRGRPDA